MRFAYVDPDARWRPRRGGGGGGGGGGGEGEGGDDNNSESVAVVVVVAAHVRPRSVSRREALLHSVLVADEVFGGCGDDDEGDDDDGGGAEEEEEGEEEEEDNKRHLHHHHPPPPPPPPPRDFVLVLFGASATVPALSYDAQFFSELHAALPPEHRDPRRMRAFYAVHAGWGLRAWLAALRLSEPAVYGRVEFVASLRDLERRFGVGEGSGGGGRIPAPPVHVVAADERRAAAAAAAGQIL